MSKAPDGGLACRDIVAYTLALVELDVAGGLLLRDLFRRRGKGGLTIYLNAKCIRGLPHGIGKDTRRPRPGQ